MNILLLSAEVTPFAKAGGLGDVAASLPKAWEELGHTPIVIVPKYGHIDTRKYEIVQTEVIFSVPMGTWQEYGRLWRGVLPDSTVPVYFIQNQDYFDREGIYGNPDGFADNDRRFLFLTRAAFEAARALQFKPDIIHAHDNHTAFAMAFLKSQYRNDPSFHEAAGVFTIHNMAYQGLYEPKRAMELTGFGMKSFYSGSWFEQHGIVNSMKTGIMFADKITTVSPTYSQEIRWAKYGEGLQNNLNERGGDLIGVLNGVDYTEWDSEKDTMLYNPYSKDTLSLKESNKQKFLRDCGLSENEALQNIPLVGMVTRLTDQKGIELLEQTIENFLSYGVMRFCIIGSGERKYEDFLRYIARKFPRRALIQIGYNTEQSHKIIAASDFLLVPSRFEPCGLTQMYALKYGTIPIVRATGGLADTIEEFNPTSMTGTGFLFSAYQRKDFAAAIRRALSVYSVQPYWNIIRANAMECDFSALRSGKTYIDVFNWARNSIR
ncbi:MAG: glycogen synthase [Ignavibacteriae bacterium]|nr:glycogen synthase [Ignavibacteriota bacterium]